jgi:hypothetical protein
VYPWKSVPTILIPIFPRRWRCPTRKFLKILHVIFPTPASFGARADLVRMYTVVYVRSQGTWLTIFTKRVLQQCIAIAHDTSVQLSRSAVYDSTYPFETPAKLLQRLLNAIMSDRSGEKKDLAYFVGNQLFRCYFKVPPLPPLPPPLP